MTQPHENVSPVHVPISDVDDAFYGVMRQALSEAATSAVTQRIDSHADLMDCLECEPPFEETVRPDMVLIGMGVHENGETDTLEQIKSDPILRRIPIVFLTHTDSTVRIVTLYEKGANSCI